MSKKKYLKGLTSAFDFIDILFRFVTYKITETKYDPDYCPDVKGEGNFISAKAAARMINNENTVYLFY